MKTRMTNRIVLIAVVMTSLAQGAFAQSRAKMRENPEAKLHRFSTVIEKDRPELNEATRELISAYQRDPSEANRAALRKQVAANYDAVVERKKAKLQELKSTAKHKSKVDEMQVIVDEMLRDREQRIDASMARFSDSRFRPGLRDLSDAYLPVLGVKGRNFSIGRTPVTQEEWSRFTGKPAAPENARLPVINVSIKDAEKYCAWLGKNDPAHTYRLPTESEWELAAGHMPKDADFNCGESDGIKPVDVYAKTKGACGGIDFWGNCWEWTSTKRGENGFAVKGGAFDSQRTACRTESRTEWRKSSSGYPNVTFRVAREEKSHLSSPESNTSLIPHPPSHTNH